MATGRSPQHVWVDRARVTLKACLSLGSSQTDRRETEVPRGLEGLAKVTLASGQEPRPGLLSPRLGLWVLSRLGSCRPGCCEHLVTNHFLIFLFLLDDSLGSVPEVEGLGYWAGEVL